MAFKIQDRVNRVNRKLKKTYKEESIEYKNLRNLISEILRYRDKGDRVKSVKLLLVVEGKLGLKDSV